VQQREHTYLGPQIVLLFILSWQFSSQPYAAKDTFSMHGASKMHGMQTENPFFRYYTEAFWYNF
jgi:hypothetical protein